MFLNNYLKDFFSHRDLALMKSITVNVYPPMGSYWSIKYGIQSKAIQSLNKYIAIRRKTGGG